MIKPAPLKKGDSIAIISTARKISEEELKSAVEIFQTWGLNVVFGPNLFEQYHQFAGTDQQRLADLQWTINNPHLKAVICARGGYGTTRILDLTDFSALKNYPKWFCGFSDVTALIGSINAIGMQAIHSTMPIFFDGKTSKSSIESLRKVLFGEQIIYQSAAHELNCWGNAEGIIIGGNLSILNHIIATASDMDWQNKILFMEDLDEYLYHIDRMMVQLDRSKKLQSLKAVIVGSMSKMNDNAIPFGESAYEIISRHCSKYNLPVCFNFPVGHEMDNYAIICGASAQLTINAKGATLAFDY